MSVIAETYSVGDSVNLLSPGYGSSDGTSGRRMITTSGVFEIKKIATGKNALYPYAIGPFNSSTIIGWVNSSMISHFGEPALNYSVGDSVNLLIPGYGSSDGTSGRKMLTTSGVFEVKKIATGQRVLYPYAIGPFSSSTIIGWVNSSMISPHISRWSNYTSEYYEVLRAFARLEKSNYRANVATLAMSFPALEEGLDTLVQYKNEYETLSPIKYLIYDLDEDGINELLIGAGNEDGFHGMGGLNIIYTTQRGQTICVTSGLWGNGWGGAPPSISILENHALSSGYTSNGCTYTYYYVLKNGKIYKSCTLVDTSGFLNGSPYLVSYGDDEYDDYEEISYEEYASIYDSCGDVLNLEWRILSEIVE
jgi:hypothetical protein